MSEKKQNKNKAGERLNLNYASCILNPEAKKP